MFLTTYQTSPQVFIMWYGLVSTTKLLLTWGDFTIWSLILMCSCILRRAYSLQWDARSPLNTGKHLYLMGCPVSGLCLHDHLAMQWLHCSPKHYYHRTLSMQSVYSNIRTQESYAVPHWWQSSLICPVGTLMRRHAEPVYLPIIISPVMHLQDYL